MMYNLERTKIKQKDGGSPGQRARMGLGVALMEVCVQLVVWVRSAHAQTAMIHFRFKGLTQAISRDYKQGSALPLAIAFKEI